MSALKLKFLSHGTLESRELEKSRAFYAECLGLEAIRTSPRSLMIRLGRPMPARPVRRSSEPERPGSGARVALRPEVGT